MAKGSSSRFNFQTLKGKLAPRIYLSAAFEVLCEQAGDLMHHGSLTFQLLILHRSRFPWRIVRRF